MPLQSDCPITQESLCSSRSTFPGHTPNSRATAASIDLFRTKVYCQTCAEVILLELGQLHHRSLHEVDLGIAGCIDGAGVHGEDCGDNELILCTGKEFSASLDEYGQCGHAKA